ncbi:MAG: AraC family transcriptional regulator N-terminal domain-containing protein [Hymenobacter sp.]
MHLPGRPAFDYLPGESVVVGEDERMEIDFPEACACQPTQCLAVAIAPDTIRHTVELLNERYPRAEDQHPWALAGPDTRPPHQHARADRHPGTPRGRVAGPPTPQGRAGRLHLAGAARAADANPGPRNSFSTTTRGTSLPTASPPWWTTSSGTWPKT